MRRVNTHVDTDTGVWVHTSGNSYIGVIVMLAMILIAFIVYTYAYRMQKESTRNEVRSCVESYTGRDLSFYDWEAAKKLSTAQIKTDVGVNENVVQDCLNRW